MITTFRLVFFFPFEKEAGEQDRKGMAQIHAQILVMFSDQVKFWVQGHLF